MTNRVYLLITVLLLILTLSRAEAANVGTSTREPIGPPSWSVNIPAMNAPSMPQRMVVANDAFKAGSTNRKKISESQSPLPQDRLKFPRNDSNQRTKQGTTLPGDQGMIFDRWGNQ